MNPDSAPRLQRTVEVDRDAAATRGVSMKDIVDTLRVYQGSHVNDVIRFGRTWAVQVQAGAASGDGPKDMQKLKVRNARGQMVPLGAFVKVSEAESPLALDFLDLWPMVELTANPGSGMSPAQARQHCETLVEEVRKELGLSAEYRLTWLEEMPRLK